MPDSPSSPLPLFPLDLFLQAPIFARGREPPGYLDSLRRQKPEIVFDAAALSDEASWIKAGETVFEAPIAHDGEPWRSPEST